MKEKLEKIIVDIEPLNEGETFSSGGARKNGKITKQYKNPRPYKENAWKKTASEALADVVINNGVDFANELFNGVVKPRALEAIDSAIDQAKMKWALKQKPQDRAQDSEEKTATIIKFPHVS